MDELKNLKEDFKEYKQKVDRMYEWYIGQIAISEITQNKDSSFVKDLLKVLGWVTAFVTALGGVIIGIIEVMR